MGADDPDDVLCDTLRVEAAVRGRHATARSDGQERSASPDAKRDPPKLGELIPFPIARRRSYVCKLAAQIAARSPAAGEVHLLHQLRRQGEVLRRKNVPENLIEQELRSVAAAVRAELWLLLLRPPVPRSGE
jgi:hypothetical protein